MRTPRTWPKATLTRSKVEKAQEAKPLKAWEGQGRQVTTEDQAEKVAQAEDISELPL